MSTCAGHIFVMNKIQIGFHRNEKYDTREYISACNADRIRITKTGNQMRVDVREEV